MRGFIYLVHSLDGEIAEGLVFGVCGYAECIEPEGHWLLLFAVGDALYASDNFHELAPRNRIG